VTSSEISSSLQSIAVPFSSVPGFGAAWNAVVSEHSGAEWLYARSPANPSACEAVARERLSRFPFYAQLAEILRGEARLYGVPDSAMNRLDLLASGKAVVVVTGQQVGYLGGPLFTLVKAYHAVRLSRALEAAMKLPVIPLFWLEGEDHDLAEVRATAYPGHDGELKQLAFAPSQEIANQEVGRYRLTPDTARLIHEMQAELGEVSAHGADVLEQSYSECDLSTAMGRLLASTLGERGLQVCEGRNLALKRLAQPLWEKAIDKGEHLRAVFSARTDAVRARGFAAPMNPTPDAFMFYVVASDYVRRTVHYDGTVKHPDGTIEKISTEELRRRIESGEWEVSPKAGLRPLYQDFVLPSIAYVAGPGELEYHAQLAPFYSAFEVTAPCLFPRMSVTIADSKTERLREKLSLSWEELLENPEQELSKKLLREADEHHTTTLFAQAHGEIEDVFTKLKSHLALIDTTLEGAAESAAGKALHPLDQLEQKANKAVKQKHSVELQRLSKLCNSVKPSGKPMERAVGTAYALLRYGPDELLNLLDRIPADGAAHHVILTE
jgi:bacillithiol biosynthesis cysteine-adding enzyme BshC